MEEMELGREAETCGWDRLGDERILRDGLKRQEHGMAEGEMTWSGDSEVQAGEGGC